MNEFLFKKLQKMEEKKILKMAENFKKKIAMNENHKNFHKNPMNEKLQRKSRKRKRR